MMSYCLTCRKNTVSKDSQVLRTKKGTIMFLSKPVACDSGKVYQRPSS